MREWFEAQLAAGLPAFAGTVVSGTLAVKQEALNELLANWLAASAAPPGTRTAPVDLGRSAGVIIIPIIRRKIQKWVRETPKFG